MATVKISGTIVSPDYDDEFFAAWIDKGVITPSSRVVSQIEGATEPVDLYINSYGGDVFAGGEMMIALLKAAADGKLRRCEVGSIAASMAANIVAALRASGVAVTAHANSQLMYHGCYTVTEGGAQHHEDVAGSLRNINEAVIANLNRIGIKDCRAWFAEGREKWIDADEGVALGLFTEISETDAVAPVEVRKTAARLAAFAASIVTRKEYKMEIDNTVSEEAKPEEAAPAPVEVTNPEEQAEQTPAPTEEAKPEEVAPAVPEADVEARVKAACDERFAKFLAEHNKKFDALKNERDQLAQDLATAKSEATSLKAEVEKLTASLAEVGDQLKAEQSAHQAVVASALAPSPKKDYASVVASRQSTPEERIEAALAEIRNRRAK